MAILTHTEIHLDVNGEIFQACVRPLALQILGTCDVTKTLLVAKNGYKTTEYKIKNIQLKTPRQPVVITAIGYLNCTHMTKGICYNDQKILGPVNKLPEEVLNKVIFL